MMIKAVLWDFGGVLTTSPFENFNRYEAANGIPRDFIRRVNATNPDGNAWAKFERSEIGLEEFDRQFLEESTRLGHPIPGRNVIKLLSGELRPEMVEALKCCAEKFTCLCLTNNVAAGQGPGMSDSAEKARAVAEVMGLFHKVLESSKMGLRKPDPRIYELACAEMGVRPEEVVYLDDLGINLKPARQMGMTTIKVVTAEQAMADLERALHVPLCGRMVAEKGT